MKTLSLKNAKGFTLIELMIVLAVIAALTVVAFLVYPKVRSARQAHSVSVELTSAAASIKSLYTTGDYESLSNSVAVNANFFPSNMVPDPSGSDIQADWDSGKVIVGPAKVDATTCAAGTAGTDNVQRFFCISIAKVPRAVCQKLVPAVISNFGAVAIDGTQVINTYTNSTKKFDPSFIASSCQSDGSEIMVIGQ